jgi:hypothetical protein
MLQPIFKLSTSTIAIYRPKCMMNPMRLLLFVLALPLGAFPIINSTSVQTTCVGIGPLPVQPDITLNASSGSGSSAESCPVNHGGPSTSASSTVSGTDATATSQMGAIGIGDGEPQANAGFYVSGVASKSALSIVEVQSAIPEPDTNN